MEVKTPPGTVPLWLCAVDCQSSCEHGSPHTETTMCQGFCFPKHIWAKCQPIGFRVVDAEKFEARKAAIEAARIEPEKARGEKA